MKCIHSVQSMQEYLIPYKNAGKKIVVIPTMGALHEGHLRLIDHAKEKGDIVVVTLFVNPLQFGMGEDFDTYPRTLESDTLAAKNRGADLLFAPTASAMYPEEYCTTVSCGKITDFLEGAVRPNHFDGVTTVVLKLFNISLADYAIFGQKDAQQVLVIKKMVRDLNVPISILVHPTVRESDGLAMSSRNAYLTPRERAEVPAIAVGLIQVQECYDAGERDPLILKTALAQYYAQYTAFTIEYIAITDYQCISLEAPITQGALLSIACRTTESNTRLIDNTILGNL